jgi:endonuclease G
MMAGIQQVADALQRIQARDDALGQELMGRLRMAEQEMAFTPNDATDEISAGLTPETIVLRTGRPVLAIRQDQVQIEIEEPESEVWRSRLITATPLLAAPVRSVGRVEVQGHPSFTWLGTGWLVRPDILVTNRHVAAEFTRRAGVGFEFRLGVQNRQMSAHVDFLEEIDNSVTREYALTHVLHVEDDCGPDIAFFRVANVADAQSIKLSEGKAPENALVATIGYPARDSRIPEQDLMGRLFRNVYGKKRLAPGQIIGADGNALKHDCSTLGGNSGSALVSLVSGEAVGLHFAGRFLEANYAVPSSTVAERLHRIERGGKARRIENSPVVAPAVTAPSAVLTTLAPDGAALSFTIPIQLTVQVGAIVASTPAATIAPTPATFTPSSVGYDSSKDDIKAEAQPEAYLDRLGYVPDFLGSGNRVELPTIERGAGDILSFAFTGNANETVLRYHNFSVVMNRARRMCFFSAVNIDGKQSRKTKRTGWILDPRIPKEYQIKGECYGNAPRFSRGHMTRREDPAWGSADDAHKGNADSMHVTNATPQMQTFNAGIWLGLEDYALDHAREDDMRICVITGPVLHTDDPTRYGVQVPVQFWKVIAFIHDETQKLCVTAYSISQAKFLMDKEFVFGAYDTHQRSISWVEQVAGISLNGLSANDHFLEHETAFSAPLLNPESIRWR